MNHYQEKAKKTQTFSALSSSAAVAFLSVLQRCWSSTIAAVHHSPTKWGKRGGFSSLNPSMEGMLSIRDNPPLNINFVDAKSRSRIKVLTMAIQTASNVTAALDLSRSKDLCSSKSRRQDLKEMPNGTKDGADRYLISSFFFSISRTYLCLKFNCNLL